MTAKIEIDPNAIALTVEAPCLDRGHLFILPANPWQGFLTDPVSRAARETGSTFLDCFDRHPTLKQRFPAGSGLSLLIIIMYRR